jgi:2-amino-4-hydroxy-6-hydroxymethyldihydropteridine diphosphokinase
MGPQDQPDYINAVMAIHTELSATTLLNRLQSIEAQQGRVRSNKRWTARTLDLDLLIYADHEINLPDLIVPHIGISERAFVLYPLQEIAPALVIPKLGPVQELTINCPRNGLIKM